MEIKLNSIKCRFPQSFETILSYVKLATPLFYIAMYPKKLSKLSNTARLDHYYGPVDQDEISFRRRALRDAVMCIAWIKLVSIICYIMLYFMVHYHSTGYMSNVIQIMILVVIPLTILNGLLLFLGALEEKIIALEVGLWLCLLLASYNTALGVVGGMYFIRSGYLTMHFMLACIFAILAISLCTTICNDFFIIFAYKKLLRSLSAQM